MLINLLGASSCSSHYITSYILGSIIVRVVCCLVTINSLWVVVLLLFIVVTATYKETPYLPLDNPELLDNKVWEPDYI